MKTQISFLDLHYILKELHILIGARVDKIYHPKEDEILFQFFASGKGKFLLRIVSGKFIFLSNHKEKSEEPSGFCMFLRKYLENSRLKEISQSGSERIATLVFDTEKNEYRVHVELFGKGNIIVTDKKNVIINALSHQKWNDREIKNGILYTYPKKEHDLFSIKKEDFFKLISSEKELVLGLAKDVGIGGVYAEEICERAHVHKKNMTLNKDDKEKLFKAFKGLLSQDTDPCIIYEKASIKEIAPFPLSIFKEHAIKKFPTLNDAFDYFYNQEIASKEEFISKHQILINKEMSIIDTQQKQIRQLEKIVEEKTRKAGIIYEKYQLIEDILKEMNKAREKYSFDEIRGKLKGHTIVKDIDGKHKKISAEL